MSDFVRKDFTNELSLSESKCSTFSEHRKNKFSTDLSRKYVIQKIKELIENVEKETEGNNDDVLALILQGITNEWGFTKVENRLLKIEEGEPLLDPKNEKFTIFPLQYYNIWQKYLEQIACFWKPEEIDFTGDKDDFDSLSKNEQHFIKRVLAFFASSDGIVNLNLSTRFCREIKITEARVAYDFQVMMENIHGHTYSLMLENIVTDPVERNNLFNSIETVPSIKVMATWALKWIESADKFAYRLLAFACVELIFFSGAFASIFWLKTYKNKARGGACGKPFMNGLITSNKFIARDEGLHGKYACELYNLLENKLHQNEVYDIVKESVQIAIDFMDDALPIRLIGMNSDMMSDYTKYIADRLLGMIHYPKIYNKKNPFKFMEKIGLDDKSNFFELRPTEYQDANIMNATRGNDLVIDLDDDDF